MSNGFKIFDENSLNILSDADYTSNTARQNGVVTGLAASNLYNKQARQSSVMTYALGQVCSDAGFSVADNSPSGVITALKSVTSFAKGITSLSANYTAVTSDIGTFFSCSSSFTFSFASTASLGAGWYCIIRNDGTGAITLDPNSTQTIDGMPTYTLNPKEAVIIICDGTNLKTVGRSYSPSGFLFGLTLSNNGADSANSVDISTGSCRSSDDTTNMSLASVLTKNINSTWAVGTGNGGLDTGTKTGNTTYHAYIIQNTSTGVVDAIFSTSATSPSMPSGYTQKRRLGAVITDNAGANIQFLQLGDSFYFKSPIADASLTSWGTTAQLVSLTMPSGIKSKAIFSYNTSNSASFTAIFTDPDSPDIAPTNTLMSLRSRSGDVQSGSKEVYTNNTGQIRVRGSVNNIDELNITSYGYVDTRGRSF